MSTSKTCRDDKARVVLLIEIIPPIQRQIAVKTALRPVDDGNKGLDKKVASRTPLATTLCPQAGMSVSEQTRYFRSAFPDAANYIDKQQEL